MSDPGSLLATLAQSSAAIVAIVGGFLVSRLVQLSSEREGLRRQLVHAQDELCHVAVAYNDASKNRLANSVDRFLDSVTSDVLDADPAALDREQLLANNLPPGTSEEEMAPHLDALIDEIYTIKENILRHVKVTDNDHLDLADLRGRGLTVPPEQESLYGQVVDSVAETLPRPSITRFGLSAPLMRLSGVIDPATQTTQARRLDESIRDEQELSSRKTILEGEVARVTEEIGRIGRPVGVTSAIVILAIYSVLGIVAPVVVMGLGWSTLSAWLEWSLVGAFVVGLAAVLAYILWYAKTLNDPVPLVEPEGARANSSTEVHS